MDSSMPRCCAAINIVFVWLFVLLLGACSGTTPERVMLSRVSWVEGGAGGALDIEQRLSLSPTMLEAMANGIVLHLVYRLSGCTDGPAWEALHGFDLSYSPLRRVWVMQGSDGSQRSFAHRHQLLAALDRIRLPLAVDVPLNCQGELRVALDLTSLPLPLRFPAFLYPSQWRLVSEPVVWTRVRA